MRHSGVIRWVVEVLFAEAVPDFGLITSLSSVVHVGTAVAWVSFRVRGPQ
jgi:hypothetical protein